MQSELVNNRGKWYIKIPSELNLSQGKYYIQRIDDEFYIMREDNPMLYVADSDPEKEPSVIQIRKKCSHVTSKGIASKRSTLDKMKLKV